MFEMNYDQKLGYAMCLAFFLPIGVVYYLNYDEVQRQCTPSPNNGRMIYFTANR